MARERHVEGSSARRDDLASEVERCDPVLLARAERLHKMACEFPWESGTPEHKWAWIQRAQLSPSDR